MVLDLWVMDGVVVSRDSQRASGYYQKHHYQCNIYYFCKVWIKHVFEFVVVLLLWLIDQRYKGRSQKKLDFFISFIRKHPFSYMRASLKKEMKVIDFSNRYLDWWVISIKEREWEKQWGLDNILARRAFSSTWLPTAVSRGDNRSRWEWYLWWWWGC